MSILSDRDITKAIALGDLAITPAPRVIQSCSVDLRLGMHLQSFTEEADTIVPWLDNSHLMVDLDLTQETNQQVILSPGEFILAHTIEHIALGSGITARVEGKSSLGRLGLAIHCTAGWIDPGFVGQITLELKNESTVHDIALRAGMDICQIVFQRVSSNVERAYGHEALSSRYQYSSGAVGSRYHAGLTDAYPVFNHAPAQPEPLPNDGRAVTIVDPVVEIKRLQKALDAQIERNRELTERGESMRESHAKAVERWQDALKEMRKLRDELGEANGSLALNLINQAQLQLKYDTLSRNWEALSANMADVAKERDSLQRQVKAALASANHWEAKTNQMTKERDNQAALLNDALLKLEDVEASNLFDGQEHVMPAAGKFVMSGNKIRWEESDVPVRD